MKTQPFPRGLLDISSFDAHIRQSAAEAARNFTPAAPQIPPLPKAYGVAEGLGKTGNMLDYQNGGTAGLLTGHGITSRNNVGNAGRAIKALDDGFFKWAERVLTPAEEIAGMAGDMQRDVPARTAVPGTALRIGARLAAAEGGGAGAGFAAGWIGGPYSAITVPVATVVGGLFGGWAGGYLPGREYLGANAFHGVNAATGLLNSFGNHAKQAPGGARGFTGTP